MKELAEKELAAAAVELHSELSNLKNSLQGLHGMQVWVKLEQAIRNYKETHQD